MAIRHVNKVELIGKAIKDPEIRLTQSGTRFASFSMVTEENRKNKDTGEWERESEFHNITVWNREAVETIENTVKKWCIVRVVGKIKTRKWQDREGNNKSTTGIVVDNFGEFEFLEEPTVYAKSDDKAARPSTTKRKPVYTNNRPQDDDSDIPF